MSGIMAEAATLPGYKCDGPSTSMQKPYLVIPPALWMAVPLVGLTRIVPVGAMFPGPSLLPCLSLVHAFHRVCIVPSQIDARNVSHAALNWALAASSRSSSERYTARPYQASACYCDSAQTTHALARQNG